MKRTIATATAGLIGVVLAAGCGGSATANTHPSYSAQLVSFGDALGTRGASATPGALITRMGSDWLHQVCQAQSDGKLVGMKSSKLESSFAQGYEKTAPAGAPSARTVYVHILEGCTTLGLR